MPDVPRRNVGHYMSLAIVKFYSRIFLKKLNNENKQIYRYVEKNVKLLAKSKADQEFQVLDFCYSSDIVIFNLTWKGSFMEDKRKELIVLIQLQVQEANRNTVSGPQE